MCASAPIGITRGFIEQAREIKGDGIGLTRCRSTLVQIDSLNRAEGSKMSMAARKQIFTWLTRRKKHYLCAVRCFTLALGSVEMRHTCRPSVNTAC